MTTKFEQLTTGTILRSLAPQDSKDHKIVGRPQLGTSFEVTKLAGYSGTGFRKFIITQNLSPNFPKKAAVAAGRPTSMIRMSQAARTGSGGLGRGFFSCLAKKILE